MRYSYFLEAKASFTLLSVPQNADDLTLRLSIVVMPRSGKEEGDGRTRTPIPNLPDVPIKCWEVGSGTSLEDAVDHISKLSMNGGLGLPPTPFSLGRFQTDGSGPGPGPGSLSPADVTTTPNLAREKSFTSEKAVLSSHTSLTTSSLQRLSSSRETTFLEAESIQTATNVPDHAPNTLLGDFGFRTYALRLSDYPLVRIAIHPPPCGQLKPGGTFSGTLEFDNPENGIRCIQVTVLMNQDEVVNGEWRVSRGHQGSDGALCRVVDEFEESTVNTSCTNFVFSVPSDAVPTFHTDLIGVSWSLKFHFVALLTGSDKFSNKAGVERLTWTMPLTVVPPS